MERVRAVKGGLNQEYANCWLECFLFTLLTIMNFLNKPTRDKKRKSLCNSPPPGKQGHLKYSQPLCGNTDNCNDFIFFPILGKAPCLLIIIIQLPACKSYSRLPLSTPFQTTPCLLITIIQRSTCKPSLNLTADGHSTHLFRHNTY